MNKIFSIPERFPFGLLMLAVLESIDKPMKDIAYAAAQAASDGRIPEGESAEATVRRNVLHMDIRQFLSFLRRLTGDSGLIVTLSGRFPLTRCPIGGLCDNLSHIPYLIEDAFAIGEWRVLSGGHITDIGYDEKSHVDIRERSVQVVLSEACADLEDLRRCGYWPYESPAPCSTEVQITKDIDAALFHAGNARRLHVSLNRGERCSGAPCTSVQKVG